MMPLATTTSHFPFPEKEKLSSSAAFLFLLLPLIWSVSPHFAAQESPRELEVGSAHLIRKRRKLIFADFEKERWLTTTSQFAIANLLYFFRLYCTWEITRNPKQPESEPFFVASTGGTKAGKGKKM